MQAADKSGLVKLKLERGAIKVESDIIWLFDGYGLTWDVEAQEDEKVELRFLRGGPFADAQKGYYSRKGPGLIPTGPSKKKGGWKYTITWSGGSRLASPAVADPEVMIKG